MANKPSNEPATVTSNQKGRSSFFNKPITQPNPGKMKKNKPEDGWYNDRDREAYDDLLSRCNRYRKERDQADQHVRVLKDEISALGSRLADQDQQVREAQESVFALMKSSHTKAEDDSIVESRLNATRAQWKVFAKEWAVKHLADVKEDWFLGVQVAQPFNTAAVPQERGFPDSLWLKSNMGKAPPILLNLELASFIGREIVTRPFISAFGFGTEQDDGSGDSLNTMNALEKLYTSPRQEISATTHLWRSQTVELFDLQESDSSTAGPSVVQDARNRREKYYRMLITKFESSQAQFLYRPSDEAGLLERRTQLLNVFRSIGELTSRLWTQKVYISILGLKDLSKGPFHVDSTLVEAHKSHKLEEKDPSLDGVPIEMVVEPAIVAWGNERGESYDTYKVWAKAVVWMPSASPENVGNIVRKAVVPPVPQRQSQNIESTKS